MKVAYVTSQFPETYETFILREFSEARRQGVDFTIFSLKKCRDAVVHPDAAAFADVTRPAAPSFLVAAFRALVASILHPVVFWGLFARIVFSHVLRPGLMARNLAGLALGSALAPEIKRGEYDIVHAHWITVPATAALAAARMARVPFSVTAHAWDIFTGDNMLRRKTREARFVATCTGYNASYLRSLMPEGEASKIRLHYHGLEIPPDERRSFEKKDEYRIFSVGRLVEQKGFEYLLDALAELKASGVKFRSVIAGEGPLRAELEKKARALGLSGVVEMPGVIPLGEVWKLYRRSDLFVLPCVVTGTGDRDGIPNVLIEAMSVRLPVVTTGVSGIPELVEHEVTGLAARERDVESLFKEIVRLLEDPDLAAKLAEAGRRRVEETFDIETNTRKFVEELEIHAKA